MYLVYADSIIISNHHVVIEKHQHLSAKGPGISCINMFWG